jgi:nucleoprotein TPR
MKIEELYALRTQRTEASSKIAHLDVEVSELKMAAESSKVSYDERSWSTLADCL